MPTVRTLLHRLLAGLFGLASLWLGLLGANDFTATTGVVTGSEFGLLISLVHGLGAFMVWTMLYALWRLSAPPAAT